MRLPEGLTRPSLARRLVLLAVGWSLAALVVVAVVVALVFQQGALRRFDAGLSDLIDNLISGSTIEDGEVIAPALTDQRALRAYSGRYWDIAEPLPEGGVRSLVPSRSLWDSQLTVPADLPARLKANPRKPIAFDAPGVQPGERLRVVARWTSLPGRDAPLVFMAAEDRRPIDREVRSSVTRIAIAFALLGLGLIVAVVVQVRVGLQPLFRLREEVAEVRRGKADRLAGAYPTELTPLTDELNALVAHNQETVERQRTHVGNLAHALKTPISVMLTEAQQRPGPLAEVVTRQADVMREQVDHHLRRARAAARSQGPGERTNVAEVLDELSRTLEKIFRAKGVEIDWDAPDDLWFAGERQDFMEIAGNAMENAGKFGRRRVRVRADAAGSDGMQLSVEDDGPGLPPDRRDEVIRRGARLDESAPGSGLGLSIIDELARAYRGSISLGDSPLGGLSVVVRLPRAAD
ncbi:ATP-binding protein [Phenylobacterium kunshanense]|uniref:histidine kinase n=1 Tax=Phenylobacterium kunshanense TaxID=1445034 RepID=A0A328BHS5_9CAUL|nr:ATP-binding protein [Phenylobacterium kunshanense]RAK65454.1 sensor histidine kinase [Phenylobacterium kunshanense]